MIKNLVSVRRFTTDKSVSVEFDPFGLSVKDLTSQNVIARCDSTGDLCPLWTLTTSSPSPQALLAASTIVWHRRLGHPNAASFAILSSTSAITPSSSSTKSICHACELGRHIRLPFGHSNSRAGKNFDLIHCDLWTSPVISHDGCKYYLVILDDRSHFV
jgi:histone deacetylase 1/2